MRRVLRLRTASRQEEERNSGSSRGCRMSSVSGVTRAISPDEWHDKVMRKCQESVEIKNKFFEHYARQIGQLSQEMAERFARGRRLWVMGNGGSACDAQHVAVEFIHPIIEKRRALPALD